MNRTLERQLTNPQTPVETEIAQLGPWFHNLHLPGGTQTAPDHPLGDFPRNKWSEIAPYIPADLRGRTVLDIGCNSGFYSFELARRGARVMAVDIDEHYLRQARWAAGIFGLTRQIDFQCLPVYALSQVGEKFDIVLFLGVFYHLRHPLLALDIVTPLIRGFMVFQTMTMPGEGSLEWITDLALNERDIMLDERWPKMSFIEHSLEADPTNWWAPNHAAVEAMIRSCGLNVNTRIAHETYLCEPASRDRQSENAQWIRDEMHDALAALQPVQRAGSTDHFTV